MSIRNKKVKVFYNERQVLKHDATRNYSKSPLKPKLLLEFMRKNRLGQTFDIVSDFAPFVDTDFLVAHTAEYISDMFNGTGSCETNGLTWSEQFLDSVRYTNSSLYNSILHAVNNPSDICFSPTSGFHHAMPTNGSGFCTFSGQAIAAIKLYEDKGLKGCFLDLDGHFGNSIEDTRDYNPILNKAIPRGFNFNPTGSGEAYVQSVYNFLYGKLKPALINGDIDYVVWCHGADSHGDDDLGHQCSTSQWIECSKIFAEFMWTVDNILNRPIPLSMALFGGYRADDYNSVLALHTADFVTVINKNCNRKISVSKFTDMVVAKDKLKVSYWKK